MRHPAARISFCTLLFAAILLLGCQRSAAPPQAPPPPVVTAARPVSFPVQSYYEYNGYLDSVVSVEIRARVKGFLEKVHFKDKEGEEVAAGTDLYTIDPRQYIAAIAKSKADIAKAVADIANARAQIKLAQADYERVINSGTAAAPADRDKAAATVESNKAQVDVSIANKASAEAALESAELDLSYTTIKAPIAGRISRTLVTPGNLVGQNENTLLTTIVGVDPLYIYFDAPEKDFVRAQRSMPPPPGGTRTPVPVEIGVATEEGFPHRGELDFQENRVDTGTGTVRIRGRVDNPKLPPANTRLLYPGLYARVRVPNGEKKQQLVLPEEALMTGQEGRFVYVIGNDNVVQKRTVSVGANVWREPAPGSTPHPGWTLNNPNPKPPGPPPPGAPPGPPLPPPPTTISARAIIAIEKGLEPGDLVIVSGLQKARPGAAVSPEVWNLNPPPAK